MHLCAQGKYPGEIKPSSIFLVVFVFGSPIKLLLFNLTLQWGLHYAILKTSGFYVEIHLD